ncbi:MAG: bifunctional diaminohydroxyphosphoribosylaminopyrimidine deaminase/5-amino-6-(5-phosphoribosylamino)uracil reductase RibD [Acidobacteriia bacterium]|nr:bifunctional diaminohydroxyphosphoribosylaminopyrimidine deaminase/5-amino-6-(5-phosphoribosylamino)uracil reductase RibD [Terriglobia bacterium]MBV8904330.1 bifunctional diaminohydroxyphosphoribosylaminopyrimidine deaminase/5-amino-6-(5-phosphoribosylamino)uracil reductase RibD [Terriglobia bacterium]
MNPEFMREALELARQGRGLASPNPMVGAVLVQDGRIVGRGYHTYSGIDHAEVVALREAGELARGATLYINLEPCLHHGRTPPCTDALIQAGVGKVVAPFADPNPLVAGGGFTKLRQAGIAVELAPEFAEEAEKLNLAFLHFMRTGRPLVTLKTAITLDGKISAPDDNRGWITSESARAHVQQLRHEHDAILTGIGTVLADDCLLTDRTGLARSRPLLRIVLDSQLRLPLDSQMVRSAKDDVVAVTTSAASPERRKALENRGIQVLVLDGPGGRADLRGVIQWLGAQRRLSLLIEAGSKVNWTALENGYADRIFFYYAPKILGGLEALPLAGGIGRRRRADAILVRNVTVHAIPPDEFAVEGYLNVYGNR